MRQADGRGAGGRLGLVVAQPAQLGDRQRRDRDAAHRVGPRLRTAELVDQVGRGVRAERVSFHSSAGRTTPAGLVEADHAVLLAAHGRPRRRRRARRPRAIRLVERGRTTPPGRPRCRRGAAARPSRTQGARCRRRRRRPCRTAWRSRPRRRSASLSPGRRTGARARAGRAARSPSRARPASSGSNDSLRRSAMDSPAARVGSASWSTRASAQRLLDLRVGAEGPHLLAQDQVVAHAALGGGPDAVLVLGARRLEVEVPGAVVAAVLDDVDGPERAAGVAGAEAQVLVVARAVSGR